MAKITIGQLPQTNYAEYDYLLDYPHWYQSVNSDFTTPGLTLSDAISCQVTWNYNQFPTLQLTYPRNGVHAKKMAENTYILADINYKFVHQLFKIVHVQKEDTQILVDAIHISATLNDATVSDTIQIASGSAQDLMNQVLNIMQPQKDFNFDSDITTVSNINVDKGQQAGAILINPDAEGDTAVQSVLGLFGGELEFDNFDIHHSIKAGTNTGIIVDYGKNIQSITQDQNIENMWTGAVFIATYTPGQAIATEDNTDWNNWNTDYSSVATVYMAGGSVNIYDSPVDGQKIIGSLSNGDKVYLGKITHNGDMTPDGKFQINTVNGDDWYPLKGGGWVDANWISFDKSGDYLVNDVIGDGTVQGNNVYDDDGTGTRVSMSGTAVVAYQVGGIIHGYYSPEIGADHYRTGTTYKNGAVVRYDMVERNQNGDLWYRIGSHEWLFGPHLSLKEDGAYKKYHNNGYGEIKEGATKYHWDTKKNEMVPTTDKVVTHGSSKQPYRWVGKGKNKHKVPNKSYHESKQKNVKVKLHKGRATIDQTIIQGGQTYHHTKYGWVSSDSINYHRNGSYKPKSWDEILNQKIKDHSKVEIYDTPDSRNASNWSIPSGASSANGDFKITGHQAQGGDGKNYIEVEYRGHIGWIPEDNLTDSTLHAPDDDSNSSDDYNANIDQSQKEVTVKVGPLYADGFGNDINIDKVNTVDLSGNFKHDDQDLSGQQPDGSFVATEADISQLTQLGQNYLKQARYGHVDVSTTVNYAEMSGINADFTQLSLYDSLYVRFQPYDLQETAEVYGTLFDCLAHHYSQIQLGKPPEPWQHLMQQAIEDKSNEKISRTKNSVKRVSDFAGKINHALKLEGASREQAFENLQKELGDTNEDLKVFENHMTEMAIKVNDFGDWIKNGGNDGVVLYPRSADGTKSWNNVVEIDAEASDHRMIFNNQGIGWYDNYGGFHAGLGWDGSQGKLFVDEAIIPKIDASHIDVDTIHALGTIEGSLSVSDGYSTIQIGKSYGNSEFGIYVGNETWIESTGITTSDITVNGVGTFEEIDVGGIVIRGRSINRDDSHVMWSASQYTNLGQYINAHIKSSAIIGGSV